MSPPVRADDGSGHIVLSPAYTRALSRLASLDTFAVCSVEQLIDEALASRLREIPACGEAIREIEDEAPARWKESVVREGQFLSRSLFNADEINVGPFVVALLADVPPYVADALRRHGVISLGQLIALTPDQLQAFGGIGNDTFAHIQRALARHGFALRPKKCPLPESLERFLERTPRIKLFGEWLTHEEMAEVAGVPVSLVTRRLGSISVSSPLPLAVLREHADAPSGPRRGLAATYPPPSDMEDRPAVAMWYQSIFRAILREGRSRSFAKDRAGRLFKRVYGTWPPQDIRTLSGYGPRVPSRPAATPPPPPTDLSDDSQAAAWLIQLYEHLQRSGAWNTKERALTLFQAADGHRPSPHVRALAGMPMFESASYKPRKSLRAGKRAPRIGLAACIAMALEAGPLTAAALVAAVNVAHPTKSKFKSILGMVSSMQQAGELQECDGRWSLPPHRLRRKKTA
jgi:hypothetical protein